MENKKNNPSSNLVNESTRELMSKKLPFVLRWGNILLLFLLLIIVGLAWLLEYPAEAQGVLLVSNGKPIVLLYTPEKKIRPGQTIYSAGKPLAVVTGSIAYRNPDGIYQVDVDPAGSEVSKQQVSIKTGSISLLRKIFR